MDLWTAETVASMVRYIADDARIARHCGCLIAEVAACRKRQPMSESDRLIIRTRQANTIRRVSSADNEPWVVKAREASDRLVTAIARSMP